MAIIPHKYLDSVVSIGTKDSNGKINWFGTGFFVHRLIDKEKHAAIPFLISNKHVLEGVNSVIIRMIKRGTHDLEEVSVPLKGSDGKEIYKCHSTADIAVMPFPSDIIINNNLEFNSFDIDSESMTSVELRDNGVEEGGLLYMLGYPMGLVNAGSGSPICRLGCVARISEAQISEKKNILVDIQNFPGNSGSPIVNRPEVVSLNGTKCLEKCVLVGIVHSYIPYQETLLNTQTKQIVEVRSENSGLANVHPVEFIREVVDVIQPKVV